MRIITGHQPVYLPWLGLFHKISLADVFVFMDDVQYLQRDWNNRNKIKGPNGSFWLTVPVKLKGSSSRILKDIRINSEGWEGKNHWQKDHWQSLQICYGKTQYWDTYASFFEEFLMRKPWEWLVEVNEYLFLHFLRFLDLQVEFVRASTYGFEGRKSDLVLDHCRKLQADICVLGMHGHDYLVEDDFLQEGISLYYQDYQHPRYEQRFGEFISHLSIVDLLFNCGPNSRPILLSGNISQATLTSIAEGEQQPSVLRC
jgi:hypothetical protein